MHNFYHNPDAHHQHNPSAELQEMKGSNKIRMIEGERILNLGQQVGPST